MTKIKGRLLAIIFGIICTLFILQSPILATNGEADILKKSDGEYLIYQEELLSSNFEFAFSNSEEAVEDELDFINSVLDSDGNYIAYVDAGLKTRFFADEEATVNMWIKQEDGTILTTPVQINLSKAITEENLEYVKDTAQNKRISINTNDQMKLIETVDNVKITTTVGLVKITEDIDAQYYYQLIKLPNEQYTNLVSLAKEISNFNDTTKLYDKIITSKEFYQEYNQFITNFSDSDWQPVEDKQIVQPEESKTGDQYVLWLKRVAQDEETTDLQILTCYRQEDKEYITENVVEQITTKLPRTYDNIILFVILGIVIVLIIALLVIKKVTSNKDSNKKEE